MKRAFLVIAVMVLCHGYSGRVEAQEASVPESQAVLDSLAKMKESRRAKDVEFLHTLLNRVKEQQRVSIQDNASLGKTIGGLIEDKVLGLSVDGRRELVRK